MFFKCYSLRHYVLKFNKHLISHRIVFSQISCKLFREYWKCIYKSRSNTFVIAKLIVQFQSICNSKWGTNCPAHGAGQSTQSIQDPHNKLSIHTKCLGISFISFSFLINKRCSRHLKIGMYFIYPCWKCREIGCNGSSQGGTKKWYRKNSPVIDW